MATSVCKRMWGALAVLGLCFLALALRAHAADYETVLAQLEQLQGLADSFVAERGEGDAIDLTLSYTRTGDYNNTIWQLTAGPRDPEFESYVSGQAPELAALQGLGTVYTPNGQGVDFGHLLAAIELVDIGIPIPGTWGGDCMQLAQAYLGQAADADGYMALMQQTFNLDDDGSVSRFGDQDLRADMDAVILGSRVTADARLATLLREYYTYINDYDRAYNFIALSFGTTDTGGQDAFRQQMYSTLVEDTGMQLLLYINNLWVQEGWQIAPETEPALRAACSLLADYLAGTVNSETVYTDTQVRMMTMAGQALVDALDALGDSDAAQAASQALGVAGDAAAQATPAPAETLPVPVNAKLLRVVLLVLATLALVGFAVCMVMFAVEMDRGTPRRRRS